MSGCRAGKSYKAKLLHTYKTTEAITEMLLLIIMEIGFNRDYNGHCGTFGGMLSER